MFATDKVYKVKHIELYRITLAIAPNIINIIITLNNNNNNNHGAITGIFNKITNDPVIVSNQVNIAVYYYSHLLHTTCVFIIILCVFMYLKKREGRRPQER